MSNIEKNLKISFSKVKYHIKKLERELSLSKELLVKQTEIIKILSSKLDEIRENQAKIEERDIETQENITSEEPLDSTFFCDSTGNKGVNQSINQSINHQSHKNPPEITLDNPPNKEIKNMFKHILKHLSTSKQSIKHLDQPELVQFNIESHKSTIHSFKKELNDLFSNLSKQELKVFLTLYQLEEEIIDVSYTDIANKMKLTEACIRGYISGLIKKKTPILRSKLNNRRTILKIKQDFKELNLKQRLISLYYNTDPYQTRLFNQN